MRKSAKDEEPRWHAGIAVAVALGLYLLLPPRVIVGPLWLLPLLVLLMLVPLMILSPHRHEETSWQRWMSIGSVALLNAFNVATIVMLFIWQLAAPHHRNLSGEQLLLAAVNIWVTNLIVYALWFWEIDGRGPDLRAHADLSQRTLRADFLFPQQILDKDVQARLDFRPRFLDYVFLSFTNATAFSPTDTFPLTHGAKVLMMAQAATSLVTIALIAGRAINILGS
ncbi:MAG: hypothetical protein ABR508_02770 [Candidatus Baltobacteraceae bacterium]